MQTWADIRQRANVWDMLDELPEKRVRRGLEQDPRTMKLTIWQQTGNMAHLGLGELLGEGNFAKVYALDEQHVAKITRIVSLETVASGHSGRSKVGMTYSGSLDMAVLYADWCMNRYNLRALPKVLGYARYEDSWLVISERLEALPERGTGRARNMRNVQGDVAYNDGQLLRWAATLDRDDADSVILALEELRTWAKQLDQIVPCYWDMHRNNFMVRQENVFDDESSIVINDPLLCYGG